MRPAETAGGWEELTAAVGNVTMGELERLRGHVSATDRTILLRLPLLCSLAFFSSSSHTDRQRLHKGHGTG